MECPVSIFYTSFPKLYQYSTVPTPQSTAPRNMAELKHNSASLPNSRFRKIPRLSITTAFMLRAVARSHPVICLFCKSICRGCMRLKQIRNTITASTEIPGNGNSPSNMQLTAANASNPVPIRLAPVFSQSPAEKPPTRATRFITIYAREISPWVMPALRY